MATNTADMDLPNKKEPSKFTNTNNKLRVVYIYTQSISKRLSMQNIDISHT